MLRLAMASACALFLELACIRWAGSHVLYLSYVSNLVLIAAFFGLGLGAVLSATASARTVSLLVCSAPWWLLAFVAAVGFSSFEVQIDGAQVAYFGNAVAQHRLPPWLVLPALGSLVTTLFVTLGLAVGRELSAARPLVAYSVDIAGSLTGIALFSLVSLLGTPAHLWFLGPLLCLLMLMPARASVLAIASFAVLATVALVSVSDQDSTWSPYQRISVQPLAAARARAPGDPTVGTPSYRLRVNNVVHQYISDVRRREPFYEFPYRAAGASLPSDGRDVYLTATPPASDWTHDPFAPRAGWKGRVAIIGAGNGTDTAAALAYGAATIDAVEIDPLVAEIGRRLQPNQPFADPRTHVHVMDGRTFLERARGPYDIIVFGLPDSLTLASPYAGLRLESFLFTEQAFSSALRLLDPGHGILVAYNYYRTRWLVDRIATTMARAAGRPPLVLLGPDRNLSAVFVAGPGAARVPRTLASEWGFRSVGVDPSVGSATDDWPFLYLRERSIPNHILLTLLSIVAVGFVALALVLGLSRRSPTSDEPPVKARALAPFFFMGSAFLLLETSGLVRMSLLFGSTWFVNALVFGSVLTMVLIANAVAHILPLRNVTPVFALLLASLVVAFWLPPASFSAWGAVPKYVASSLVWFVPVLLGNLAFSRAFRDSPWPAQAFGANLLGAVVGGVLENVALVAGYRALFLIAGALYTAAWLSDRPSPPRAVVSGAFEPGRP